VAQYRARYCPRRGIGCEGGVGEDEVVRGSSHRSPGALVIPLVLCRDLRQDHVERQLHVSSWRDGIRDLLTILARPPSLFVNMVRPLCSSRHLSVRLPFGPRLILGKFALLLDPHRRVSRL